MKKINKEAFNNEFADRKTNILIYIFQNPSLICIKFSKK
jgi:hypothetical protein